MADNGKQQQRSRWLQQIEHCNAIEKHIAAMQDLNSMDNFDLQKGADFFRLRRESLTNAIEESGGQIEQGSIEHQIRDFIPKSYRPPTDDNAQ